MSTTIMTMRNVKNELSLIFSDSESVFFIKRNLPKIALVCFTILSFGALLGLMFNV